MSNLSGFGKRPLSSRQDQVVGLTQMEDEDQALLLSQDMEVLQNMSENVIGAACLPFSVATNFLVNGKDVLIPMVTEESSVVAASSFGAKLARPCGGFTTTVSANIMSSQVVMVNCPNVPRAMEVLAMENGKLTEIANAAKPSLSERGGGVVEISATVLNTSRGDMISVYIYVDVCDCMGANTVTTIAEELAPHLQKMIGGTPRLKIVSNLNRRRIVRATATWTGETLLNSVKGGKERGLTGEDVIEAILDADAIAECDPARAATHNKGIMNGVCAVGSAFLQDTRALESAAHTYACSDGKYKGLTEYKRLPDGRLEGTLEIPFPIGTVGGASHHATARLSRKISGIGSDKGSTQELASLLAAVGLAQNFAALRALVTDGMEGHMRLHAVNFAMQAGATGRAIESVAGMLIKEGTVSLSRAKAALNTLAVGAGDCNVL